LTNQRLLRIELPPDECAHRTGDGLRYLFELTTSAQWTGAAVGIVRVEQELARRARSFLSDDVAFCVYERSQNLFLLVDHESAAEILQGHLQIDFGPEPPPARTSVLNVARRKIRRAMRTNLTVYQAFQRLRGRRYTREELLRIQREEFDPSSPTKRVEHLSRVSRGPAKLDAGTCVISVGLDWQYKDLRSLWSLKQSRGFRYCAMIHDLIPLSFPHFVTPGYDTFLADYFGELIWLADLAMCNSESTRQDWMRFCHDFGVDVPSYAFPLGCDLPAAPTQAELPPQLKGKQFALFVSTIEPRKNHRVLYDAWDRCIGSGAVDAERDRLVFVGRAGWQVNDLMRELAANPATRDSIVVLNEVGDDVLAALYRACAFVLFPSFCEGYGIPVAEALGYAKLCITSNAGSLTEIGGDLVRCVDPKDTLGWAHAIAHYMAAPAELDDWSRQIKSEHRPVTWNDAARRFFTTIRDTVS
jgi:glycosyltransferase involved in cell wall biosynthesis